MNTKVNQTFPITDLVILAAGQSQRMNGENKLLMKFDDQIQLKKIIDCLEEQVQTIWINSHRDREDYLQINPDLKVFKDEVEGFRGPLVGMKTAWNYTQQDFVLFVPCDVTTIPKLVVECMHNILSSSCTCQVVYLTMNQQPLYPFCLMKRSAHQIIAQNIEQNILSLHRSFQSLAAKTLDWTHEVSNFHSINSFMELKIYQKQSFIEAHEKGSSIE